MNEKEWIVKCQQGDAEAFNTLVRCYESKVIALCYQFVKEEEIAKDLAQEAFLKAFQNISSFRGQSLFYTWLYRITSNLCTDYLKKKKKTFLYQENYNPQYSSSEESLLQEFLPHLPRKQREVIEMSLQFSQKEIARKLNIPYGTVRSRLHYAKKKIRDRLRKA